MGILTTDARIGMAQSIKAQEASVFLAIGRGNWEAENMPAENADISALADEIGRRALFRCSYVTPDNDGAIETPEGARYAVSAVPTRFLCFEFQFDYLDGVDNTLKEVGLFIGCNVNDGLPPAQRFFIPGEIADPGKLFWVEHRPPLILTADTRMNYSIVIAI